MSNSSDLIKDWDTRLIEQAKRGWDNYIRRRIHLDVARSNECWHLCGEFLYVEEVSSASAVAEIRLNRDRNDAIDLERATTIKTIFTQIFITHAAVQDEWIDIVCGINFEYYKQRQVIQQPLSVDDGGGSLTVDGTFFQATQPVSAAALPLPAGAATSANQLADGHNVTNDNGAGAAAVNIQDGGNVISVDAAALPLPAGAATSALQLADGHNVTNDNAGGAAAVNIQDGGNSLTVDGAVTAVDNGTAQECTIITHVNPDTNQAGANHACKRVLIRAHTTNTGLVWVNFGAAAVDGSDYPLDKGDAMSVPITNTNQVNCLFKVGGEKVTVVYTN